MGGRLEARKRGGLDAWLWEHHQDRLLLAIVGILLVPVSIVVVPAIAAGSLFLGLSRGEATLWFLSVNVVGLAGVAAGTVVYRRHLAPFGVGAAVNDPILRPLWALY